jgi:hypothetical protein
MQQKKIVHSAKRLAGQSALLVGKPAGAEGGNVVMVLL